MPERCLFSAMILIVSAHAGWPAEVASYRDIFRVSIPKSLPSHPRVFCTQADLDRIKADAAAGDAYTLACIGYVRRTADACLARSPKLDALKPSLSLFTDAERLAQAYALTGDERYGRRCRRYLLALADACPKLKTTRAAGRFTDSTLHEGPIAVRAAMAYDLIAAAPFMGDDDRRHIERDLLRIIGWECGHGCRHANSSNWRSWGLAIVASCGFASGDRELIEEAINGVYDPKRRAYLYGIVQQLTHSIFSDGIHWERSLGYSYYTMGALMYVMVAAKNSGIDLWHAKLPGILGPFEGSAPHEEYGPAGDRSIKAFLDAPFYYAFPGGRTPCYGDSGTRSIRYHDIYEFGFREYHDPKYAWLIRQRRETKIQDLMGWQIWRAAGEPRGELVSGQAYDGRVAFRMVCSDHDRIALVQDVTVPAHRAVRVNGRVKALRMAGASAHIRCNFGKTALFTNRVRSAGDWTEAKVDIPALPDAKPGEYRTVRLHVFLEGGTGEALWDDIRVIVAGDTANRVINGSFEARSPDGRPVSFWALVHYVKDVPEGRYSLADDATIGLSGRHVNGCTLFPKGGFAVLRSDPTNPEATAVNFAFGPYGSGHDHPDRLHFDLFGLATILCPDAGSWGYSNPMHLTWANTTIAHNTVTVDEISQAPQGNSHSIWAGERGSQRVFGVLRTFHAGQHMKVARATCDTAYPGVTLDRTLCLVGSYVLDVFRVQSDKEHTYDLALHGIGTAKSNAALRRLEKNPFTARGYSHLTDVRRGSPNAGTVSVRFSDGDRSVRLLHVQPEGGEIILAKDPAKRSSDPRSCFIARHHGKQALFVTLMEPHRGKATVVSLAAESREGAVHVVARCSEGRDRFTLPDSYGEPIQIERTGARGERVFAEQTK